MNRRVLGLAVALATACGQGQEKQEPAGATEQTSSVAPLDALSRRFGRVRSALRERGYQEMRRLDRKFAVEGSGVAVPMDLPTGACSTVVALGGGELRDLRLTLYDGAGDEVAIDGVEREGGLVYVCPQGEAATRPYHLVYEAHEGSGAITAALFASEPGHGRGFEGVFDDVLAPQVPFGDVEELLSQSRTALRERGLDPLGEPRLEVVAEGEALRESIRLEAGECYAAVAHGGEGLGDVDLFLYDSQGAEVARDLESDAEPSLEHCPERTGRHIFEVRAFEGAGALGLMVLSGAEPEGQPDAGLPEDESEASSEAPSPDPVAALDEVTSSLTDRGYEPVFALREHSILPGEVRSHQVLLGPGCGVVVGAPGRPGVDLDLYLGDGRGRSIDRDARVEPSARVSTCPEKASVMRVTVKAYGREAPYAITVLRAPTEIVDVRSLRLEEAGAPFRARGYEHLQTFRATLERGERLRRTLDLRGERCVAIATAGSAQVEDLDLFLKTPDGQLVASESGPGPWAAVSRCIEEDERLQLEVLMYRGEGDIVLERLERPHL